MICGEAHDKEFNATAHNPPSQLKTYGFILAIIVGVGGLAAGGAGAAGYFQIGALSNMDQIDAIIMMAAGGGGGLIFLIIGIVRTVKNQKMDHGPSIPIENQADNLQAPLNLHQLKLARITFSANTFKGEIRGDQRFGKAEWEKYFGEVGKEPPLPEDIDDILNSPCPFSENESVKVKDTHMLVLIPATVNGENLTLDKLGELIKNPKCGRKARYRYYDDSETKKQCGQEKIGVSRWVLMTKDVLPGSKGMSLQSQRKLVSEYKDYHVPQIAEASVCILMEYIQSGTYLFSASKAKPDSPSASTYTLCEETLKYTSKVDYSVMVGAFDTDEFAIHTTVVITEPDRGVAALRRL